MSAHTRVCPSCRKAKLVTEFPLIFNGSTGRHARCQACIDNPPGVDIDRLNYTRGAVADHLKGKKRA